MKKNNSGFALAETLIVSTVVAGILVYLFIQFSTVKRSFNTSFKYNTVPDLYALEDVADYINNLDDTTIDSYFINTIDTNGYYTIYKDNEYIDNTDQLTYMSSDFKDLLEVLDIERLIVSRSDTTNLATTDFKPSMVKFISRIKNNDDHQYRLIAHFNDNTFSTLEIKLGDETDE